MGFAVVLVTGAVCLATSLAHDTVSDDERGTIFFLVCFGQRLTNLFYIVAVNFDDVPVPCSIFHGGVLGDDHAGLSGELDFVGVEEHDEVVQSEVSRHASCALGNLFLHAAVRDVGINLLFFETGISGASIECLGSDGSANGVGVSLSERSAGVFDASFGAAFGMTGRGRAPLTKTLQIIDGIVSDERKLRIEHRGHVSGVEIEAVSTTPGGMVGIKTEEFTVEHIDEICSAHGSAGVT